jgi:hypothetical protein
MRRCTATPARIHGSGLGDVPRRPARSSVFRVKTSVPARSKKSGQRVEEFLFPKVSRAFIVRYVQSGQQWRNLRPQGLVREDPLRS